VSVKPRSTPAALNGSGEDKSVESEAEGEDWKVASEFFDPPQPAIVAPNRCRVSLGSGLCKAAETTVYSGNTSDVVKRVVVVLMAWVEAEGKAGKALRGVLVGVVAVENDPAVEDGGGEEAVGMRKLCLGVAGTKAKDGEAEELSSWVSILKAANSQSASATSEKLKDGCEAEAKISEPTDSWGSIAACEHTVSIDVESVIAELRLLRSKPVYNSPTAINRSSIKMSGTIAT